MLWGRESCQDNLNLLGTGADAQHEISGQLDKPAPAHQFDPETAAPWLQSKACSAALLKGDAASWQGLRLQQRG